MRQNKAVTCLFTLLIILSTAIIAQQIQVYQLSTQVRQLSELQQWLYDNYGVTSIEELKTKLTQQTEERYIGNPFVTSLYQGQLQAENITFMHGYWYNPATGQLENKTDIWAFPEQTATFIIFGRDTDNDGVLDVIYAKNTTSGQIQYGGEWNAGGVDGSNASAVIQAALSSVGDKALIYVKPIELDSTINLDDNVNIIFEKINWTGNADAVILNIDQKNHVELTVLECSVSTNFAGTVLRMSGDQNHVFIKCSKASDAGQGSRTGKALSIYADASHWATFNDVRVEALYFGTALEMSAPTKWASSNMISVLGLYCDVALNMSGNTHTNHFDTLLAEAAETPCFYFDGGGNDVDFLSWTGGGGVEFRSTSKYTLIKYFGGRLGAITDNGTGNRILWGLDYAYDTLLNNRGVATFSGTSVSFAHGLAGTPTQVFASFNSTGYGDWSWTANSTHITITVANTGDYAVYWRAYYEP